MMLEEYPELSEITLHGVKQYASFGARDVLILVSKVSGGDVLAKKHGELTQQDRERFSSEGIPEDCWEEDAMLMKARYLKDERYESVNVEDCHEIEKEYVLEMVTSLLKNTSMPGVVLHYIGPGRRGTGDWCFCDGFISFRDIANVYTQHFTGRTLAIVSDCSYSGKWVESCKEFLDEVGVQPCGHSARKKGIKIKLLCSCQSDQRGSSLTFSARGNRNDKNIGTMYVKFGCSVAPDQTTCGVDSTNISCEKTPEEECTLVPSFTYQEEKIVSRLHTVRVEDKGKPAWRIVLLLDDPETMRIFKENTLGKNFQPQTTNLEDYGKVIKSGWGKDPPEEVEDWLDRVLIGIEVLSY